VVIFLPDVFTRYIEPQVEASALEVLAACGYDVHVLPIVGAGASFLSKGMIEAARRHAWKMLEMLSQADPRREASVVGLEPPEVYLLKHDYADLLPHRAEHIRRLESRVWLIDEFLVRSKEFKELVSLGASEESAVSGTRPPRSGGILRSLAALGAQHDNKLFFHPHCHQRAEGLAPDGSPSGASASVALLRACGYDVQLSEAGCCGMAGTFGFEAEHYDLSMKIAGLRLLPALIPSAHSPSGRGTSPKSDMKNMNNNQSSPVVFGGGRAGATGASCRMQIKHGSGLEARHPIEWVRDSIYG
jgi:Fe-S oxidoreductase